MPDIPLDSSFFTSLFTHEAVSKILIILGIVLAAVVLRMIALHILIRRIEDVRVRYLWQKTVSYGVTFLAFFLILWLIFQHVNDMATIIGFLSAGIAIALRDVFTNFAGWVFITWVRPFRVSDRIQVGAYAGDVIDISLFHTTLMEIGNWVAADQSTGRVIKIPNQMVFSQSLANYTQGFQFIWNELPILITFESNWKRAKEILLDIANRHAEHLSELAQQRVQEASRHFMIYFTKLTPTVYTSVQDSGVLLTIRYLCEPRRRRGTEQAIWEDVLAAFAICDDIDFAYPTKRFFDNSTEGKPGIRQNAPQPPGTGN